MTPESEQLLARAAADAITVQDACNLSGVVFSFARHMEAICRAMREDGHGTDWKNAHPVAVMFASKIASLTHCEDMETFAAAYAMCRTAAATVEADEETRHAG